MDVAVDPERRLVNGGARRSVRRADHPDIAPFVALADRLERYQLWMLGGERMNDCGQFRVAHKAVESDRGHGRPDRRQSAKCGGLGRRESTTGTRLAAASDASPAQTRYQTPQRCPMMTAQRVGDYCTSRSNAGVPLVSLVLPVAAFAAGDLFEAVDELDAHDVLGMLVSELTLDAKANGRAIGDRERFVVELVGKDGLWMVGVVHVDALVIRTAAVALHRIGAMEYHVTRRRCRPHGFQHRRQRRSFPFADRTPAFDAIVAGDLRSARQRAQFLERKDGRLFNQATDFQAISREATRCQRFVLRVFWHRGS